MPGNYGPSTVGQPKLIPVPGGLTSKFNQGNSFSLTRTPSRLNQLIGVGTTDGGSAILAPPVHSGWMWSALGVLHQSAYGGQEITIYLGKPDPTQPTTNSGSVDFGSGGSFPDYIIYEVFGHPLIGELLSIRTVTSSSTATFPITVTKPVPGPVTTIVGAVCHSGGNGFDGTHVAPSGWVISSSGLCGMSFPKGAYGRCVTTFNSASGNRSWDALIVQVR